MFFFTKSLFFFLFFYRQEDVKNCQKEIEYLKKELDKAKNNNYESTIDAIFQYILKVGPDTLGQFQPVCPFRCFRSEQSKEILFFFEVFIFTSYGN